MYYIYCYKNKINNHCYIGQTNNIDRRKREHLSVAYNKKDQGYNYLFHKKIRQYGIDNFDFEIIDKATTKEETNKKEIYWIKQYKSYVQFGNGYNLTLGGEGTSHSKLSQEQIVEIKKMIKQGINYDIISKKFNISQSYISSINYGVYHNDSTENYPLYQYYKKDEEYAELIDLLKYSDLTFKEIASKLNIGESTIKKINYGKLRNGLSKEYPIRKITPQKRKANKVKELLINNYSDNEIMSIVKVSQETIRRINLGLTNKDENLSYPLRKPVSTIKGQSLSTASIDTKLETGIGS